MEAIWLGALPRKRDVHVHLHIAVDAPGVQRGVPGEGLWAPGPLPAAPLPLVCFYRNQISSEERVHTVTLRIFTPIHFKGHKACSSDSAEEWPEHVHAVGGPSVAASQRLFPEIHAHPLCRVMAMCPLPGLPRIIHWKCFPQKRKSLWGTKVRQETQKTESVNRNVW